MSPITSFFWVKEFYPSGTRNNIDIFSTLSLSTSFHTCLNLNFRPPRPRWNLDWTKCIQGITPSMFLIVSRQSSVALSASAIYLFSWSTRSGFPLVTLADALTKFLQQNFDLLSGCRVFTPFPLQPPRSRFRQLPSWPQRTSLSLLRKPPRQAPFLFVHCLLQFQALVRGFFIVFAWLFRWLTPWTPSFLTSYFPLMTDVQRVLRAD